MRRHVVGGLVAAVLLAGAAVSSSSLRDDDEQQKLGRALDALVAAGMPGAIVRVRDGEQTVELARGEASPGIRFRVGSVTKTFVAALTLRLADRQVLGLDDPVDRYLPGLLRDGDRVTIRDLLS